MIKNRVCYVSMELTPSEDVVHGDVVLLGLPKPHLGVCLNLPLANGYSYSAQIDVTGKLIIYYPSYVAADRIDTCFSYLIA